MNGLRVVPSGTTALEMTRTFAAPRPLVFAALTRPDLLKRWHGARGWHLVVCEVDLRPGGAWRFVSRGPGDAEMVQHGVYRVVREPDRLVQTEAHDGWPEGDAVVTTVLDERDEGTSMTATVRYRTRDARDTALRSPMERGAGEAYDRLAALITALLAHPERTPS